jgi:hypothetical protein
MKRLSYFLGLLTFALCLLTGSVVKADVVDPKVKLGPTGTCANTPTFQETSLTQVFTGLQTGCINDFQNEIGSGVTLEKIVINITSHFAGTISCELLPGSPFNGVTPNGSSATSCTFFEKALGFAKFDDDSEKTEDGSCEEDCGGIKHGGKFGLTFDPNFGPTVDIAISQQVFAPEPATLLLLGTGFMAFLANKKRSKSA